MAYELKVPSVGESIVEVEIGQWLKKEGDTIRRDDPLVELVTDKATLELPAPVDGVLEKIMMSQGSMAQVNQAIALLKEGAVSGAVAETPKAAPAEVPVTAAEPRVMPAAERVMVQKGLLASQVEATGPGGRILKEDAERAAVSKAAPTAITPAAPAPSVPLAAKDPGRPWRQDEVVPMTPLRRRIAERLLSAQQNAAMLTTFNEADMSAVLELRKEYGEAFLKKHGVKLGFMSFFVKASVQALQQIPQLNAEIQGSQIVYHKYYDIGIAVGGGEGLVVPVLRDADRLNFAEIERAITDFAGRIKARKIMPDELAGGTFSITNAGVYGSTQGTPFLNPPQVGVLGMYAMQEKPVVRGGQVVVRPIMGLALTYDHRLVDGREAGLFLQKIKELIENPVRLTLEV